MRSRHPIGAGGQPIESVAAGFVGDGQSLFAAGDIRQADRGAAQDASGLVGDLAAERIGECRGGRGKKQEAGECDGSGKIHD